MTIKGRTTQKWGRDKSARWDSNPGNGFRTRSYPHVADKARVDTSETLETAIYEHRPGHAERDIILARDGANLRIETHGWYSTSLDLNERQIAFLRDTLNAWFPPE